MSFVEKKLEEHAVYEGRVFTVYQAKVQLPDGREALRDRIAHSGGAGILALSARDTVYLVRQYRFGVGKALLEIPAGKLEKDESPEDGARRELKEETGCIPGRLEYLFGLKMTPGFVTETVHHFLATDLRFEEATPDAGEFLQVERVDFRQAVQDILAGRYCDGKTVAGVLAAAAKLNK